MVIGYYCRLRPGQIVTDEIRDPHGVSHNLTFKVMGKSNFQEWQKCFFELGGDNGRLEEWLKTRQRPVFPYFYEIHTD